MFRLSDHIVRKETALNSLQKHSHVFCDIIDSLESSRREMSRIVEFVKKRHFATRSRGDAYETLTHATRKNTPGSSGQYPKVHVSGAGSHADNTWAERRRRFRTPESDFSRTPDSGAEVTAAVTPESRSI